jgi:hypothetical protein
MGSRIAAPPNWRGDPLVVFKENATARKMQPVAKTGQNSLGQVRSQKKELEKRPPLTATDCSLAAY